MTDNTLAFDAWIRNEFVEHNNALEALYWKQSDRANVVDVGGDIKASLVEQGNQFISQLLQEGNTDEGFDAAFDLLGNVGLFMAACRRHEITEPSRESFSPLREASALSMQIGASIGVTPRFATAHLTTHNQSINGTYKRFTDLDAEKIFVDYNTRGIFAYKRAADALLKIKSIGISHPIAADLLLVAHQALKDVYESNEVLFSALDTDAFFYQVRPYYKPYRVGQHVYRGANAGDFAGINVIDLLLGLCLANESSYSQLLVDKFLYMMPEDQQILRDCMRMTSFMDEFLSATEQQSNASWYQQHLALFLDVCDMHGRTAVQHHNQLVEKYIAKPAATMEETHLDKLTASGPPLHVLLGALEKLRDRRNAAERSDIFTRFNDIQSLRNSLV
ncbi:tryptophan 2,3-dioxygenase [Veronia nyctiphanis]|uniref:Tryptophan 2,3-dioxygenase n=1 Tax=Veronia nyctiphanis TaxID=1278244 RepID=A0A4Q0YII9_9GAMM|nr:monodechloroaminopyrrolnitrin synthase PrnB family protein [Veronia nyctiphanis]RXJ68701.1 tryptophan 2,3-dioxygenase [Veronia nyctiphanis]